MGSSLVGKIATNGSRLYLVPTLERKLNLKKQKYKMENKTKLTAENKALNIADVRRSAEMISEQFEYRGFTFQRMTKDARWYVCFANQIVNWGQYQNDLKEWVDGHYA